MVVGSAEGSGDREPAISVYRLRVAQWKKADMNIDNELPNAKILVVDDEAANVKLLQRLLSAAGYQNIDTTTDPREVADMYRQNRHDIVLLDIRMPHKDGFEVMKDLHEVDSDDYIPVLVLTAQIDPETRLRALEGGAKDFLNKPFDRWEVLNRIKNMLEVRLLHNQVRDQNRILEEKVRERTQELFETRLEIIRRLGRAAEYRDNETGNHIIRMSKYSEIVAAAAGFSETDCELILNASPMHDIGKIGIPDRILLKPGKLDAEEWEIMKSHVTIGAEILSGHHSELMNLAREIALSHHEKWDGSGYPNGLSGEEIPEAGRIVALSDVFDALTSERPYKKAWSVDDAMAEIRRNKGSHFEPRLVDLFEAHLPAILEVKGQYVD